MIYDQFDVNLIRTGKPKQFNNEENKFLTPIYYDNSTFSFTLKNKYFTINTIEENVFGKDFITIKSKELSDAVKLIADKLNATNPLQSDGSIKAIITSKSKIERKSEIRDKSFEACVSFVFPTIFTDNDKTTLQIHVKELVVIRIVSDELVIDFDKLEISN